MIAAVRVSAMVSAVGITAVIAAVDIATAVSAIGITAAIAAVGIAAAIAANHERMGIARTAIPPTAVMPAPAEVHVIRGRIAIAVITGIGGIAGRRRIGDRRSVIADRNRRHIRAMIRRNRNPGGKSDQASGNRNAAAAVMVFAAPRPCLCRRCTCKNAGCRGCGKHGAEHRFFEDGLHGLPPCRRCQGVKLDPDSDSLVLKPVYRLEPERWWKRGCSECSSAAARRQIAGDRLRIARLCYNSYQ